MNSAPSRGLAPGRASALTLGLLGVLALGVLWALLGYWGANPDYADRFLILAAAGWAAWTARSDLRRLPIQPLWLGSLVLLVGGVLYPVGWFLQASAAPRPDTTRWVMGAWMLCVTGVVLLQGSASHLRRLAFPLVFLLFALPIPHRVEKPLQAVLQMATTSVSATVLPVLGVPVVQNGYVLSLPGGDLGVVEACSGVRSVTALTAIAAFVAYHQGLGLGRGLLLLGLSIPLIAAVNAVRVILSGLIQEYMGVEYIRGYWHDALGIAMIVLGLFVVLGLTRVIRPNPTSQRAPDPSADPVSAVSAPAASPWPTRMVMMVLSLTLLATAAAQYLARRAISPDETPPPQLESIPLKLGPWIGTDLPVPDDVAQALTADEILHRLYSHFGYEAQVWVMYWSSRQMMRGYHHPDICWPNRGFQQQSRDVVEVQLANGGRLPITVREFARGTQRQLVLYWTQEGRRVWTEEDERRAEYEAFSHEILLERLVNPSKPPGGRLTVLIGTQTWGDGMEVKARTLELSGRVADELYRLCPWAAGEVRRE